LTAKDNLTEEYEDCSLSDVIVITLASNLQFDTGIDIKVKAEEL